MLTKIEFVVKTLHVTIKYTFYLAVRNVERQIVSCFVTGVQVLQPIYTVESGNIAQPLTLSTYEIANRP